MAQHTIVINVPDDLGAYTTADVESAVTTALEGGYISAALFMDMGLAVAEYHQENVLAQPDEYEPTEVEVDFPTKED